MNTATFSSTMLVNITSNDPKEISDQVNKALNDVLSKLNNLSNSINTTQTQAQATYAPLPQSTAGVGQFYPIQTFGGNQSVTLPAGGLWIYSMELFNGTSGTWANHFAGFASGGTLIGAGSIDNYEGWAYRYA